MSKRAAASFLWFAATWLSYEILWSIGGLPRLLGPIVAAAIAMFVAADPFHLFWARPHNNPTPVDAGVHAIQTGGSNSH